MIFIKTKSGRITSFIETSSSSDIEEIKKDVELIEIPEFQEKFSLSDGYFFEGIFFTAERDISEKDIPLSPEFIEAKKIQEKTLIRGGKKQEILKVATITDQINLMAETLANIVSVVIQKKTPDVAQLTKATEIFEKIQEIRNT